MQHTIYAHEDTSGSPRGINANAPHFGDETMRAASMKQRKDQLSPSPDGVTLAPAQLENRVSSFLAGRKNSSLQTKVDLAGHSTQRKLTLGQTGNLTIISVANSGAGLRKTQHIRGEDPEPIEIPQDNVASDNQAGRSMY